MVINQNNKSILYSVWDWEPLEDLLILLKLFPYKRLVIDCTNEYDVPYTFYNPTFREINDYCFDNNIEIIFHTGAYQVPYAFVDGKQYPHNTVIRNHPMHFLVKFYTIYIKQNIKSIQKYFEEKKISNYYYILNNIPHYHRCKFLDTFHKYELNKVGKFTWNITTTEYVGRVSGADLYQFEYWEEKVTKDELNTYKSRKPDIIPSESYFNSLFDIVLESTTTVCFFTEKTVRPLVYGKPFILVGHRDLHANLVEAGFKLFDNIVDYSFDSIEDVDERIEAINKELKRLSETFTIEELYRATKDVVEYNKKHIKDLATSNYSYYGEIVADFPDVRSYIESAERDHFLNFIS